MLIELGTINYKLIIPLFYPFFYQVRRVIHQNDEKPFYEFFTNYCGYLFSGLVYWIILRRMRKRERGFKKDDLDEVDSYLELTSINGGKDQEDFTKRTQTIKIAYTKTINQISIEKEKLNSQNKKSMYISVFCLAAIYLIPMFLDSYSISNKNLSFKTSSSLSLFFCIISYVSLSRIILGKKIYRHQFFSLAIIIVCNIISIILMLIGEDNSNLAANMGIMFVILSLYALYNVLEKKYFNKYMDSPYHMMFCIGFISLIFILLYETITVLAAGKDRDFNGIFYQIELNFQNIDLYPLLFIGDVLSAFLWVAGIHLTVYFFTPCHFIISESVSQIISNLINNSIEHHSMAVKVIIYILFCIIFFSALIYNEVIIINIWSLDKDTKKHIENRAKTEKEILLEEEEEVDSKNNINENTDL